MEAKLEGQVYSFIQTRGFGFCIIPDGTTSPRRFFIHISKIASGAENMKVGAKVRFSVSQLVEGALPAAVDIEVLPEIGGSI